MLRDAKYPLSMSVGGPTFYIETLARTYNIQAKPLSLRATCGERKRANAYKKPPTIIQFNHSAKLHLNRGRINILHDVGAFCVTMAFYCLFGCYFVSTQAVIVIPCLPLISGVFMQQEWLVVYTKSKWAFIVSAHQIIISYYSIIWCQI